MARLGPPLLVLRQNFANNCWQIFDVNRTNYHRPPPPAAGWAAGGLSGGMPVASGIGGIGRRIPDFFGMAFMMRALGGKLKRANRSEAPTVPLLFNLPPIASWLILQILFITKAPRANRVASPSSDGI